MTWLRLSVVGFLVSVLMLTASISRADTQFRVILDASGSMQTSDPDHLAGEAISLLAHLAPNNQATLGVWQFGEEARVLLAETLINQESKSQIAQVVSDYQTLDERTDLESILTLLLDTPDTVPLDEQDERHWILVTDGMVDISLDEQVNNFSRNRIINELTRRLENRGVKLHTISMSAYTDKELLKTLSVRTGASHMEVASPESLLTSFERIFNQAVPYQELPFENQRTYVDSSVDEMRFTLLHRLGQTPELIGPDGQVANLAESEQVKIVTSDHFSLVTITRPDRGVWELAGLDESAAHAKVITSLQAQPSILDSILFEGETFRSAMQGSRLGSTIENTQFINSAHVEQRLYQVKGESKTLINSQTLTPAGFQFVGTDQVITEPGNYELITQLDARDRNDRAFLRQTRQTFYVAPAIRLQGEDNPDGSITFMAVATNQKLDPLSTDVFIEVRRQGETEVLFEPMELTNLSAWQYRMEQAPQAQDSVRAQLLANTRDGVYEYLTPVWHKGQQSLNTASLIDIDNRNEDIGLVEETGSSVGVNILPAFSEQAQQQQQQQEPQASIAVEPQVTESIEPDVQPSEARNGLPSSADQYINWFIWIALGGGGFVMLVLGVIVYRSTRT